MSTVRRITILVLGTLLVLGAGAALETALEY
jgi:hypothetical protein